VFSLPEVSEGVGDPGDAILQGSRTEAGDAASEATIPENPAVPFAK
jgi:hypothetical protein